MPSSPLDHLSRREREVIQIIYSLGEASAIEVQQSLETPTKNAATRKILTSLLEKGAVARRKQGKRYIYAPTAPANTAADSVLQQIVGTFFKGSYPDALLGMIELGKSHFGERDLENLRSIVKGKA